MFWPADSVCIHWVITVHPLGIFMCTVRSIEPGTDNIRNTENVIGSWKLLKITMAYLNQTRFWHSGDPCTQVIVSEASQSKQSEYNGHVKECCWRTEWTTLRLTTLKHRHNPSLRGYISMTLVFYPFLVLVIRLYMGIRASLVEETFESNWFFSCCETTYFSKYSGISIFPV